MKTQIKCALNIIAALVVLTGCVSDSDCTGSVNLEVKFAINLEMEHYTKAYPTEGAPGRYVLEIFEEGSSSPLTRFVAENKSIMNGENDISAKFSLPAAKYKIVTWVNYNDEIENFYDVTDLSAIKINPDYHGSCDLDNAFVGVADIDLTAHRGQQNVVVKTIPLECPFAKIRVITTDVGKFTLNSMAKGMGSQAADLSTFTVRFTYPGFLPTSFNVFQNNPNDASTGVTFTSQPVLLADQEYLLGYDYVLVNGTESSILLNLAVIDGSGQMVNSASEISIPIARGKITTIRGEFLTGSYTPGMMIDPKFGGEINITMD